MKKECILVPFGPYEYDENDFYTYVPGEEIDVLVNTKDEKILTMVPSSTASIKSGLHEELDNTYVDLVEEDYDYVYVRLAGSNVKDTTILKATNVEYVDKFEDKDDYVRINGNKYNDSKSTTIEGIRYEPTDEWLILSGEDRVSIRDLEVGDILVRVTAEFTKGDGKNDPTNEIQTFYVIGVQEAEGELTRYVSETYEDKETGTTDDKTYKVVTVGGEEYFVHEDAKYVEDPEAKTIKDLKFYDLDPASDDARKMKGEDVVLKLDPIFRKVVRVEFDGDINGDEGSSSVKFYGVVSPVERESSKVYTVTLVNEDGEEDYTFANNTVAKDVYDKRGEWATVDGDEEGALVAVELNDDNEIEKMDFVAKADTDGHSTNKYGTDTKTYWAELELDDQYTAEFIPGAYYDKDEETIKTNKTDTQAKVDVANNVVAVTLVCDDGGTESKTSDDKYSVEFDNETGLDIVDNLNDRTDTDDIIVIYETKDSEPQLARYVVLFDKSSDKSDHMVGLVTSDPEDIIGDRKEIEVDDTIYALDRDSESKYPEKGDVIVYTLRTNSKDEEILEIVSILKEDGLQKGIETQNDVAYQWVSNDDDSSIGYFTIDNERVKVTSSKYKDQYEDYLFVAVTAEEGSRRTFESVGEPNACGPEDLVLDDRIWIDEPNEVYYIISGLDPKGTTSGGNNGGNNGGNQGGNTEQTLPSPEILETKVSTSTDLYGKPASELQKTDITITPAGDRIANITGTLNYVEDYIGFSNDKALQYGHYLALEFPGITENPKDWSFTFNSDTPHKFDDDNDIEDDNDILVLRITEANKSNKLKIYYKDNAEPVITYDLTSLELANAPTTQGNESEKQALRDFFNGKTSTDLLTDDYLKPTTNSTITTYNLTHLQYTTPEPNDGKVVSGTIATEISNLFYNLRSQNSESGINSITFNNNIYTWNTVDWVDVKQGQNPLTQRNIRLLRRKTINRLPIRFRL